METCMQICPSDNLIRCTRPALHAGSHEYTDPAGGGLSWSDADFPSVIAFNATARRERREKIATAIMAGFGLEMCGPTDAATIAVKRADALIKELDK